jgi:hypothetical protein
MGTLTTTMTMDRKRSSRRSLSRRHPEVRAKRATANRLKPASKAAGPPVPVLRRGPRVARPAQEKRAAESLAAPALDRLMAWLSPAYPLGAFS